MNTSFHGRRMFHILQFFTVALSINIIAFPVRTSSLKTPLSRSSSLDSDFQKKQFNNDETDLSPPYRRFLQSSANGFFENYITTWSLPNFEENVVNMEMIIDITLTSGALNAFSAGLYNENFGQLDTVEAFLFNDDTSSFDSIATDRTRNVEADGTITVRTFFGVTKREGDTFRLKYVYNVTGGVCIRDGRQGIDGTWASLVQVSANNIEYDFILGLDAATSNIDTFFTPKTDRFTENERNSSYSIFISYDEDELEFGEAAPEVVFFGWKDDLFRGDIGECHSIERSLGFIIILATVPAAACLCLVLLSVAQRFYDRQEDSRSTNRLFNNLFNSNTRDIVLSPQQEAGTVVRAVLEEEDPQDLDNLVPVRTLQVQIDDYEPGATGSGEATRGNEGDIVVALDDETQTNRNQTRRENEVSL